MEIVSVAPPRGSGEQQGVLPDPDLSQLTFVDREAADVPLRVPSIRAPASCSVHGVYSLRELARERKWALEEPRH